MASNSEEEQAKNKKVEGLHIFGMIIPWWLIVLVLVILFVSYHNGLLVDVVGKPDNNMMAMGATQEVALAGPVVDVQAVNTPQDIAEIKRFGLFRNRW